MEINKLLKISQKQLDIVNNYELKFKEFGINNLPVMVLVHGFADNYHVFNLLIQHYKERFHIYALQMPTVSNESVVNKKQLNPLVYAYHVTKFLIDKNLKDIVLVGHSMGGGIVTYTNNLSPSGIIKTSILFDPMNSSNGINLLNIFKINPKTKKGLIKILPLIYYDPYKVFGLDLLEHEQIIEAVDRYPKTHKNNAILFMNMASLKNKIDLKKAKDNNPVKSLVIFGKEDKLLMWKNAKKSFLKGKNFDFELINQCGHVPFVDQPKKTIEILDKWLKNNY